MVLRATLVNTLHKDIVQFLCHCDLSVLQLSKSVDHDGIMEVLLNHGLKELQIVSAELADALVQGVSHFWISLTLTSDNRVNVLLALLHVQAELSHVSEHELSVGEKLLVLHQILDLLRTHIL